VDTVRQVFWLSDQPTILSFPFRIDETVAAKNFVPDYSGGPAPDFHGIPYYALKAPDAQILSAAGNMESVENVYAKTQLFLCTPYRYKILGYINELSAGSQLLKLMRTESGEHCTFDFDYSCAYNKSIFKNQA